MESLSLIQWILLIIALLCLVPSFVLIKYYRFFKVDDYLILSGFFIATSIGIISNIVASQTNELIFYKLHYWGLNVSNFFLFVHATRIIWKKAPRPIWYLGVIWGSILVFLITFWEIMEQPESAKVLFVTIPHSTSSHYPQGAGLMTQGGVVIYSTAHRILSILYFIFTMALFLFAYYKVEPVGAYKKNVIAKRLWMTAGLLYLMYLIWVLPWFGENFLKNILVLLTIVIISYISIFLPEAVLISEVQLTRTSNLYKIVEELYNLEAVEKPGKIKERGTAKITEYLSFIKEQNPDFLGG